MSTSTRRWSAADRNGIRDPAERAFAITPADDVALTAVTRGIFTGAGGDIAMILAGDTSVVTFASVAAGIILPLRVKVVNSTNTTATGLVGIY